MNGPLGSAIGSRRQNCTHCFQTFQQQNSLMLTSTPAPNCSVLASMHRLIILLELLRVRRRIGIASIPPPSLGTIFTSTISSSAGASDTAKRRFYLGY